MKEFRLTTDLFSIPCEGNEQFIIYAPLKKAVFLAEKSAVEFLGKLERKELSKKEIEDNKEILESLASAEILNGKSEQIPSEIKNSEFFPNHITIIPTTNCNLRCVYCYSNAGETIINMDWDTARGGIELAASCALRRKGESFSLGFHGGGEPTLRWSFLKRCIKYAQQLGQEKSLKPKFSIVTNGLLDENKVDFIGKNFHSIIVSVDGPEDIQDRQRPHLDGSGSSLEVFRTLKRLDSAGIRYGIRVTVTEFSVNRLDEIVEFFCSSFHKIKTVQFEPLFGCGRCLSSGWSDPSSGAFINNYIKAKRIAERYGLKIRYSGTDLNKLTMRFCGAAGNNCYITPHGNISSCIEVTSLEDPRSDLFFYGRFNKENSNFNIDEEKLLRLRNMIVQNIEDCQKCFLKWNCAGDCLAKRFYRWGEREHQGPRCNINRSLAIIELKEALGNIASINTSGTYRHDS